MVRTTLAIAAFLLSSLGGVSAADAASLTLGVTADAAEDRRLVVTGTGTADGTSGLVAHSATPVAQPAPARRRRTSAAPRCSTGSVSAGSFSETSTYLADEPRRYLLCGWIRRNNATEAQASLEFSVRGNASTVALEVPATGVPEQPLIVTARGTTEIQRALLTTVKPAGGAGCGTAYTLDTGGRTVFDRSVSGAFVEQNQQTFSAGATSSAPGSRRTAATCSRRRPRAPRSRCSRPTATVTACPTPPIAARRAPARARPGVPAGGADRGHRERQPDARPAPPVPVHDLRPADSAPRAPGRRGLPGQRHGPDQARHEDDLDPAARRPARLHLAFAASRSPAVPASAGQAG